MSVNTLLDRPKICLECEDEERARVREVRGAHARLQKESAHILLS